MGAVFERLPGFRDFYPEDCSRRSFLFRHFRAAAKHFGFREYDAPLLEPLELYLQKSGPEIVEQLFAFTDKGGREVALRPELTPSLARLVGAQAASLKRPIKWFAIGENFRYEKPQKGRLRAHYQFNADILGEAGPGADAELMALALSTLRALGLGPHDCYLRLSDRQLWMAFLAARGVSEEQLPGVLGVIDKLEREPPDVSLEKLAKVTGGDAKALFAAIGELTRARTLVALRPLFPEAAEERLGELGQVVETLQAMGLGDYVAIDFTIVRGLAYYTGFVWEVFERAEEGSRGRAVCGGGRYDQLVAKLGYHDLPACGFGMGDVVLGDLLAEKGRLPEFIDVPDCYLISGAEERPTALAAAAHLRAAGFTVEYPLRALAFGKQFKQAGQSGSRLALVFGSDELARKCIRAKELATGEERDLPLGGLTEAVGLALAHGLGNLDDLPGEA